MEVEASLWRRNGDHGWVAPLERWPQVEVPATCECGHGREEHGAVATREGVMVVCPGDWIVTGVEGEHYPVKPAIFHKTYERAT